MRTDGQQKTKSVVSISEDSNSYSESQDTMNFVRKSLHPLQVAAGDKENLVGAGVMVELTKTSNISNSKSVQHLNSKRNEFDSTKTDKKKSSKIKECNDHKMDDFTTTSKRPNKIKEHSNDIIEDMTSTGEPSSRYWERLAETRRKALDKALLENEQLKEELRQLATENDQYKQLLANAQEIIDALNEVIAEAEADVENEGGNNEADETVRQN